MPDRLRRSTVHYVGMHVVDTLDQRLIALLRADGRASISKLSASLNVSRGTTQNRLDRLIESGAILGFTVRVRQDLDDHMVRAR
jgi:DNA-binding Lrp family transcriptional regulator